MSKKYKESNKQWTTLPSQGGLEKLPNSILLKTRLLTDGGFYGLAEQELLSFNNKNISDLEKVLTML
jgi:hypothetical protein